VGECLKATLHLFECLLCEIFIANSLKYGINGRPAAQTKGLTNEKRPYNMIKDKLQFQKVTEKLNADSLNKI
jgi:hypothetical protein